MSSSTIRVRDRVRGRVAVLSAVVAVFAVAPMAATAAVYTVSGSQVSVSDTLATMTGGLNGTWTTTHVDFKFDEATGRLVAWGTESFDGCLDLRRNGCDLSDPHGTLLFKFVAWQKYDPQNSYAFVTGACIHPVTGATGGFEGARGVIAMKDTPHADGSVTTSYLGVLAIPSATSAKSRDGGRSRSLLSVSPRVTCGS
jgi:hypothetical protein